MKRYEVWKQQYRDNRYMENLSHDELKKRAQDIFINLTVLKGNCKIGLPPINEEGKFWMIQWTHLLEEFFLRFGPSPAGFDGCFKEVKISDPRLPLAKRASECVTKFNYENSGYTFKYGHAKFLRTSIEKGRFKISPASNYDDPSLNRAVRDNELEIEVCINPRRTKINVVDGKTGEPKGQIDPIGNRITYGSSTNYYVFCLSSVFAPRLYLDFDYDACLVIKDLEMLMKRINAHISKYLTGWLYTLNPVTYIDPLNCDPTKIDIYLAKHFRYHYQKEIRALWLPQSPQNDLKPLYIEIGSLDDICELIEI